MSFFRRHSRLLLLLLPFAAAGLFPLVHPVLAQDVSSGELLPEEIAAELGTGTGDIRITIARIVRYALGFLGTAALLLILYGGFLWMTAAGDETRVERAKKTLGAAVIGLAIIMSAFAIVSYVLGGLLAATGGGPGGGGPGGGGPGGGGFGSGAGGSFRPTAIRPAGPLNKYDVVASVTFSAAPTGDVANIRANLLLERVSGNVRTPVDYEPVVQNNTIKLVPPTPCPAPHDDRRCLEQNAEYVVTVRQGLRNASPADPRTVNCGISAVCSQTFRTGEGIPTEPPTAAISSPIDGASVPAGDIVPIQSLLTDGNGIGVVEYFADGEFFAADGNAQEIAAGAYRSQVGWDTAPFAPVRTVTLTARVSNIDDDEGEAPPVRVVVRPAHCFNGARDGDEADVDCGGADCGACAGAACQDRAACASGQCVNNQCVQNPQITDVQLRDGRPGNLVTLTGKFFGGAAGRVTFLGAAGDGDDAQAPLAACTDAWASERIVVLVPDGAKTGPIRVTAAGGSSDATNDAFGPIVPDFQVNDTARPGICSVNPLSLKAGQPLTVDGLGFGGQQGASRVRFARAGANCAQVQNWNEAAAAASVEAWGETRVRPILPNLQAASGGTNYLVRVEVGNQPSNTACIRLEPPEAGTEPRIDFMTPEDGSVGTYVTLFGANFGSGGTVRFENGTGNAVGDVSFPAQCAEGAWQNASVTVKVPARFTAPANQALALGDYSVRVVRSDGRASNAVSFTVNTDPLAPGICRIEPDNGPAGIGVTLFGDGFGNVGAGDLPGLIAQHPDIVRFHDNRNAAAVSLWQNASIAATVPAGVQTGPVRVRAYSGADFSESNGVNFRVQDCRQAGGEGACSAGTSCCADGACRADCGAPAGSAGGYAWQFSTGPIPVYPIIVENAICKPTPPTQMPSPNPFKGTRDVCTDLGAVAVRFSLPMDAATMTAGNVVLEKCGGDAALAAPCAEVAGVGAPDLVPYDQEGRSMLTLPVGGLDANAWYRLTLRGAIRSLGAAGRDAQALDGDFDGRGGGDYVTSFKTGAGPCALAGLDVQPARGLIDAADETLPYRAFPLSNGCIILQCSDRAVAWTSSDPSKATILGRAAPLSCQAVATPVEETDPGSPVDIKAAADGVSDQGELTVDYANPRIVSYGPRDCTEACVNTVPFAYFNTPMATVGAGSILTNVRMHRCRNESCLSYENEVQLAPSYNEGARLLTLDNPGLAANVFYRVVVSGGAESTSGAALTGLNFNNRDFTWIFRTRADGNPCGPQRVRIEPDRTTLRYVGEVGVVSALPVSSPDRCAADGQILSASSYDWEWNRSQVPANPVAFRLLPDVPPGTLIDTNPVLPAGCSTNCVMTGSRPPGTPACGNGSLENGEGCDTPGLNGCNVSCLLTGNASANGCGDAVVQADRGEECDEGVKNGAADSGCTSACLLTGSVPGISECGNGSVGAGEACDDGNRNDGDGCNVQCLKEGSRQDVYVCGNGQLEPGEQCDYELGAGGLAARLLLPGRPALNLGAADERNPTRPTFACSNACLLRGNPSRCADGVNCCGNGVIEAAKGEGCDAGADNGRPGSGCSASCIKTGANPALRAWCGDGVITVASPDPVSGVQNGGGEECEAPAPDNKIDPVQAVEARNQCDARNNCTGAVIAAVGNVRGQGAVSVECSCRSDGDCAAFGNNLSCGAGACCFPRPEAPDISPKGGDECRNARITILFADEMDTASLTGNILVEACPAVVAENRPEGWWARIKRGFSSFFGRSADAAPAGCGAVTGRFQHAVRVAGDGTRRTWSAFAPDKAFAPDHRYLVTIRGGAAGVKTVNGVGYPAGMNPSQEFSTGAELCDLDAVQIDPSSVLLQRSDAVQTLTASPMTDRGGQLEPIAPVPGVYDWAWSWHTVPEATPPGSILTLTSNDTPVASVQANEGKNGREQVFATARITADTFTRPSTVGRDVAGKSVVTVLLCEQPWPRRDNATGAWSPYVDDETHFEMYYCRDQQGGPLPELQSAPVQGQSGPSSTLLRFCRATQDMDQPRACVTSADCNGGDVCQSKDLFFRFGPEWHLADAIGFRVYDNPERLTPDDWYRAQRFSGRTETVAIDGYEAIRDDRTMYIGAVDKYGDPELRSYIFVFGYDDKADARAIEVFRRLMASVRFNTNLVPSDRVVNVCKDGAGEIVTRGENRAPIVCSSDLDCYREVSPPPAGLVCDADKDKLRRDMRRWQDARRIENELDEIRSSTGFYPRLDSGTFVRGFTTSKWPSWTEQLGDAGRLADPLNAFNRCADFGSECSITRRACRTNADCDPGTNGDICKPRFEDASCYNDRAGVFLCPAESHVYQYRAIGGADYRLSMELEYGDYPWAGTSCASYASESACDAAVGCAWTASGQGGACVSRLITASLCGGLYSAGTNRCLATGAACEDSAACGPQDSCVPTPAGLFGPGVSAVCGNGLVEAGEACEVGMEQVVACGTGQGSRRERCTAACAWQEIQACPGAAACGNGSLEAYAGEACDDGAQNGQYGRCRSGALGCARRCVNVTKRAQFVLGDVSNFTCSNNADCAGLGFPATCTDRMNFCGDGVKNGAETCDDGARNGEYGFCSWDCTGAGPRCGDNETNGAEACDGNRLSSAGVCVNAPGVADNVTVPGAAQSCTSDAQCGPNKVCARCANAPGGLPQARAKGCYAATAPGGLACTFEDWSACRPAGACGNGTVEGAEECDAGGANSATGACLPNCRRNVCNDGFVRSGIEQCDAGAANGVRCTPQYGRTCNYCKNDCTIETISGAFCGDRTLQTPPESCDPGPVAAWCSRTYPTPSNPTAAIKGCNTNLDCVPGVCRNYPGASFPQGPGARAEPEDRRLADRFPIGQPEYRAALTRSLFRTSLTSALTGYAAPLVGLTLSGRLAVCPPGGCNPGFFTDDLPPSIGNVTLVPGAPTTASAVTIGASNVTDAESNIARIDVFLTSGGVRVLKRTCEFNPHSPNASCSVDVGLLSQGNHTITIEARDGINTLNTRTRDFVVQPAAAPPPEPPPPALDPREGVADPGVPPGGGPQGYVPPQPLGTPPPEGSPCWTASDCAPSQFCQGGEGQCLRYNAQCTPQPYTNLQAQAGNPRRTDGACNSCSNACVSSSVPSPAFCGDVVAQLQFGEQCDGAGDARATGRGSTYVCAADCTYDPNGGYCGDNILQQNFNEACDTSRFPGGVRPSCAAATGNPASVGGVECSAGCGFYTGGCTGGQLLPGDFRFSLDWPAPKNGGNEVDLYVKAVYQAGPLNGQTRLFGWRGGGNTDPRFVGNGNFGNDRIRLFWDSTQGNHEQDPEIFTLATASLPAGQYFLYANAGTCFRDGNFNNDPDFDRNSGWFADANAATKAATAIVVESGNPGFQTVNRDLLTPAAVGGDPCVWYVGRIDKAAGAQNGTFTLRNRLINKEPDAAD